MFFGIILARLLFVASMVFIIGYVFGSFSKSKTLTVLTKIATILAIVFFIGTNIMIFRGGGWRAGRFDNRYHCAFAPDSSIKK